MLTKDAVVRNGNAYGFRFEYMLFSILHYFLLWTLHSFKYSIGETVHYK
jgi:hypothetical protein